MVIIYLQMILIPVWSFRSKDSEDISYTTCNQQTDIFARMIHKEVRSYVKCKARVLFVVILAHVLKGTGQ